MENCKFVVFALLTISVTSFHAITASDKLSLQFHHHFSDTVRQWQESHGLPATWLPEDVPRGSAKYYEMLVSHDLHRHYSRFLAEGDIYSFTEEGNETRQYLNLLHYAVVELGTPSQTFLVMLDTGSHIFWLPCNCQQCAPNSSPRYGNVKFQDYMPNASTTSKTVTCGDSQCGPQYRSTCLNSSDECTYAVRYAMANTSSSGILMQDVLSFINERNTEDILQLPIVFGCGEVQTGALLEDIPNGLMGLGIDSYSVPTMLAKNETISDSFSMCFGEDGNGRLRFGDKGNPGQNETPIVVRRGYPYYNINITAIAVGSETIKTEFIAIVDSGANFALLEDPLYTQFTELFSAQVEDTRITESSISLDYCYQSNSNEPAYPSVSFTTEGGSQFPMLAPTVELVDENSNPVGYCLAVVKTTDGNLIGAIAMTGLNVVFDREKLVLGWQEADCYGSFKEGTTMNERKSSPPSTLATPSSPGGTGGTPETPSAPHVSFSNRLNNLVSLFMMGLPVVLFL